MSPDRDISRPTIMVRRSAWSARGVLGDEAGSLGGSITARDKSVMRAGIVDGTGGRAGCLIGIPRSSRLFRHFRLRPRSGWTKNELLNVCEYSHSFGTRPGAPSRNGSNGTDQTQFPPSSRANYIF